MSGRKYIRVSESEYNRLQETRRLIRDLEKNMPEIVRAIQHEQEHLWQTELQSIRQRQQAFEQAIQNLSDEVREWESNILQRIKEQDWEIQELRTAIEAERRARECQFAELQRQINAIAHDHQRKMEIAREWLEAAQTLADFIEGHYRHEQFTPGQLARLRGVLEQAQLNLELGIPETALAQAQDLYMELSDLRLELEYLEREWQRWQCAAIAGTKKMLEITRQNRTCRAMDIGGRETDIDINVDFWTEGKLTELEEEIEEILKALENPSISWKTEDLQSIAEDRVRAWRKRLQDIVQEARLAVIGSQLRVNIADLVVQALQEQGYVLSDSTYEGEDMRGGFVAKVTHPDGSEIVIEVVPKEGAKAENELQIHSFDVDQRSEHELRRRAEEITSALQDKGLGVSQPTQVGDGVPDPALQDLESVRKRPRPQRKKRRKT